MLRGIIEIIGRGRGPLAASFPDDVVLLEGEPFGINLLTGATYINLPPSTAAILMSPEGLRYLVERGGYLELRPGRYGIQFIDLRERQKTLVKLTATTSDGFAITIDLVVWYRVLKPSLIVQVENPTQMLFKAAEAAAKNYMLSHAHDEVIKTNENESTFDQRELESYVRREVSANAACAAFEVVNLRVEAWEGDAKFLELRKNRQIQERENLLKKEQKQQEQKIVDEDQTLEKKKADVEQVKVEAEARRERILADAQRLKNEVAISGKMPEYIYTEIKEVINAFKEMPGFPRNAAEAKILQDLTGELLRWQGQGGAVALDNHNAAQPKPEQRISELSHTLLDMIRPPR